MSMYFSIDGVSGPVTTPPFVGAFQCQEIHLALGTTAMYVRITAGVCRPLLYSFCLTERLISKVVFTDMPDGGEATQEITWKGVIIRSLSPPNGRYGYNSVEMTFSYNWTSLQSMHKVLGVGRSNAPLLGGVKVQPPIQSVTATPLSIGQRRWI